MSERPDLLKGEQKRTEMITFKIEPKKKARIKKIKGKLSYADFFDKILKEKVGFYW